MPPKPRGQKPPIPPKSPKAPKAKAPVVTTLVHRQRAPLGKDEDGLTPLQAAFVVEFPKDMNATQAYGRARALLMGGPGPSDTAKTEGCRYLTLPHVQAKLAAVLDKALDPGRAEQTVERLVEEMRRLAFFDPAEMYQEDGHLKPIQAMAPAVRACIRKVRQARVNLSPNDGVQEWLHDVDTYDKTKAMEMLGRYHQLFKEVIEVQGDWDKLAAFLASARQRGNKAEGPDGDGNGD